MDADDPQLTTDMLTEPQTLVDSVSHYITWTIIGVYCVCSGFGANSGLCSGICNQSEPNLFQFAIILF